MFTIRIHMLITPTPRYNVVSHRLEETCYTTVHHLLLMKHCCEERYKVYVCYVYFRKAFENLWINGMLYKLYYEMGIMGKCLRRIHQGSVARKVDNFIQRIVTFSNFLNMFSNCYNPDKKSLFSS